MRPFGNFSSGDVRTSASGPIVADKLAASFGFGFTRRDGFTTNDITGNDIDSRSATFGKAQLLWKPNARWEARGVFSGERARDGDYSLSDLAGLRAKPFHAFRTVEGFTHRNIRSQTVHVAYAGTKIDFSNTAGFLHWDTDDLTDLDYTSLALITRSNAEKDFQFTEEARFSSAKGAPIVLSPRVTLKWQAGAFLFTQNYEQDAVNNFSPFLALAVPGVSGQPALAAVVARRSRRRRLRTDHVDHRQDARHRGRRARRSRAQDRAPEHVLHSRLRSRRRSS